MKKFLSKTNIFFVFVLILGFVFSCKSDTNKVAVDFDKLFPQTPFGYVLESCMQLCAKISLEMSDILECSPEVKGRLEQEFDLFSDALVGKLFHIKTAIENIKCQKPLAHPEDIVYLTQVFDEMLSCYKCKCAARKNMPQMGYVSELIRGIKKKLRKF